jgi:hypothetical protein
MTILSVSFSAMNDDFVMPDGTISNPVALILRRKADGTTVVTISEGSDDEHNRGLYGLKIALDGMNVTTFMAMQQSLFETLGVDMTTLIDAEMGVKTESGNGT